MKLKGLALTCAALTVSLLHITGSQADEFKFRIASGHAPGLVYVNELQQFFIPEVSKRVAARTQHKVEFIEGWGGSMVKLADTLEGVQSGIIDFGAYCFCFEPSNLPLHAFQVMLPFGPMSPTKSLEVAKAVYAKAPHLTSVFEDKFGQKLIAIAADSGYNLMTTFDWNTVADLKGRKISGAGLNLKWLEYAGATPVQTTMPEVYSSIQTGVYQGLIMYPAALVNFKFHEVAKYYTEIGFGTITWIGLTTNKAKWQKMPKEVQDIILQVAAEWEKRSGPVNEDLYPKYLAQLRPLMNVKQLPESVRQEWAKSLAGWPQEKANELNAKGLPASLVLKLGVEEAEKLGHKWPVRYEIK